MSDILDKIKQVQEKTGCLTLEAKKLLESSNGDVELAIRLYQEEKLNKGNSGERLSLDDAYNKAIKAKEEGDYLSAVNLFEKLKDYKDSEALLKECEELETEKEYQEGLSLKKENNIIEALEVFKKLKDYKDSEALLKE